MKVARQKLALHWGRKVLSRGVRDDAMTDVPLTVMMPLAPKDVERAARSIPMLQRNLMHPIDTFVVVAPRARAISDLCARLGIAHLDERPVLEHLLGPDRFARASGWIRQQMLKLAAPDIMASDRVLVIDSDTYPQRPTAFTMADRTLLYRGDRNMAPFHRFTEALIGPTPAPNTSFVAHTMLIEKDPLGALHQSIAARHDRPWVDAVLDHVERPVEAVGVLSEFDLYGHFMLRERPDAVRLRYYANIKVAPDVFLGQRPPARWQRRFRFLSNHQRG